jgi:hypothetical protein
MDGKLINQSFIFLFMKWTQHLDFDSLPPVTGHSMVSIRYLEDPENYTIIFIFGGISENSVFSNTIYALKIRKSFSRFTK